MKKEKGYDDRGTTRCLKFYINSNNTSLFKAMGQSTSDQELEDIAKDACSNECLVTECLNQYFAWSVVQYHKGE